MVLCMQSEGHRKQSWFFNQLNFIKINTQLLNSIGSLRPTSLACFMCQNLAKVLYRSVRLTLQTKKLDQLFKISNTAVTLLIAFFFWLHYCNKMLLAKLVVTAAILLFI